MVRTLGLLLAAAGALLMVNAASIALAGPHGDGHEVQAHDDPPAGADQHPDVVHAREQLRAEAAIRASTSFALATGETVDSGLRRGNHARSKPTIGAGIVFDDVKPYYILGERKGLALVAELPAPISSDGPWIRVDNDHLRQAAGLDATQVSALQQVDAHDEREAMLQDLATRPLQVEDFITEEYRERHESVSRIQVLIDSDTGQLFGLEPYVAPPPAPHHLDLDQPQGGTIDG